jgi:hypothetical protein
MKIVENAHTFKMNQSALRQIAEHNETNSLQIGKKYAINESKYTYIGRNNFSLDGTLLSESMNTRVKKLVEADNGAFQNFTRGDTSKVSIPDKFYLPNGQYTYSKSDNSWYGSEGKITDKQFSSDLNSDAIKDIEKYNNQDRYPVNSTIQYGGKTYTYTGMNWVSDDGKRMSDKFLNKVEDWLDENPNAEKQQSEPSSNDSSSTNSQGTNSSSNSTIKVGQRIQDKNNKVYVFNGTDFLDASGNKLSPEQTAKIIQKHKEWQDSKSNNTEDDYAANNHTNLDSDSNPKPNTSQDDQQPASSTEEPTQDSSSSESSEPENSSTEVPNGYLYKSRKGNSYFKKNGQWFNAKTKQPINSSSVPMLERTAQSEISKFNSSSPVKIGQEFKSKKGITYRYVGGERFISDNGKLLPPDTSKKVLSNLSQQSSGDASSEQDNAQGEPQDASVDNTNSNDNVGSNEDQPEQNSSENSQEGNDPLQGLANEIKSSPLARKIVVLLSRGDDLSLLAADILLSGQQKEASDILKSLNTED